MNNNTPPGKPGINPRWTSSAKDGIGTAYNTSSQVWYTVSHGIINEIYYPHVDSPNTRDLQFLITDGETFCHEEKIDLRHQFERPEPGALLFRYTNRDPDGRYQIIKEIIGDPHSPMVLMSVKVEISDESLKDKLRIYTLLAPHLKNTGGHNSAKCRDFAGNPGIHAYRAGVHLALACTTGFTKRSVGYVGESDGWRDLMDNYQMDWQYREVQDGNIAMTGEIDLSRGMEFIIGVSLGDSCQAASTALTQSFLRPFAESRAKFIEQWKRSNDLDGLSPDDPATDGMIRLSQQVLLAHEDKTYLGATVASMSIPWGQTKDDSDLGGYHLVWARDMVQTMTALMACGSTGAPLRALAWLACIQNDDGKMPQNSQIDGTPFWKGIQLDEVAHPVILAWRLRQLGALKKFNPWIMTSRAVKFLILHGPVTAQERWEENSGYSPSTLSVIISAIICAADFAEDNNEHEVADFLRDYSDWISSNLERWTVTDQGELVDGKPRHYVRITPETPTCGSADPCPNTSEVQIANGGGKHPTRNIVDGGFLNLVRLGIRAADDPIIVDSVAVIDEVLKRELPGGSCWRRYNHDGYGNYPDGSAFDGKGEGRSWPLLTGERGHYELAAGREAKPYIKAMEKFSGDTGLLAEQLWDAPDLPDGRMTFGKPAGSAMPLCWAHAEYISLVRSEQDGVCFDRIEPVYERYVRNLSENKFEIWTLDHQPVRIATGKNLRIICDSPTTIHWTTDGWESSQDLDLKPNALGLHVVDLPVAELATGSSVSFTFHWQESGCWEGKNFDVKIAAIASELVTS